MTEPSMRLSGPPRHQVESVVPGLAVLALSAIKIASLARVHEILTQAHIQRNKRSKDITSRLCIQCMVLPSQN